MAPRVVIRQFRDGDIESVRALFVDGLPPQSPEEAPMLGMYIQSCLESDLADISGVYIAPGGNFWVAAVPQEEGSESESEEVVVGMVALEKKEDGDGELRRMSIKQEFRRLGVGKQLVAELERWAKANGFETISLWTGEVMTVAHKFYTAMGYEKESERAIPEDPNITVFGFAKQL